MTGNLTIETDYSPVVIPTLCRYEHIRKCIESLRRCIHAEKTDVYVGLDYPAKASHWEGYKKICEYLPTVTGFRNLMVYKRDINWGSDRNSQDLREQAEKEHLSCIYVEDDIEVSPNFLDYIHKGLVKFQDDPSVLALSGFSYHNDLPCDGASFYHQRVAYSAWGTVMTFENYHRIHQQLTRWYSIRKLLNPIAVWRVIHLSWGAFLFLMMHALNPRLYTDYVLSNYMLFEGQDTVMPSMSLVRNNGFDGSGEHCCTTAGYREAVIDNRLFFDFVGTGHEREKEIYRILRREKREMIGFCKMLTHIRSMLTVRIKRVFGQ